MPSDSLPGSIQYICPHPPAVFYQPYLGQSYPDRIPDTYDIAIRAALAINALTGSTNPLADHELYWKVIFARNPVVMNHDWNDWCQVKFMEALPLLRQVTGSTQLLQVDETWQRVALQSIGPDGLYYIPIQGRPWAWLSSCWVEGVARADGSLAPLKDPSITQITHPFVNSRMLGTFLVYWLRDRNPVWLEIIRQMVDRLSELATYREDYAYFPALVYEPGACYDKDSPTAAMPRHLLGGETTARLPESLGKTYRLTGYEPARVLGEKIVRYVRGPMEYYGPEGEFLAEKHFHAHCIYLLGLLEFATAVGDRETVEFVRRGYEWAKTETSGAADVTGYFPEVADPAWPSAESCTLADMIALALKLSQAGAGDYYGDAERWTRNHFAEAQLSSSDWVNEQSQHQPASPLEAHECAYHTAERNVGAFAQGSSGNEFWVKGPDGIVHCCTGNAARTLFYLWQDCVEFHEGILQVNLLLNHASAWADLYSFIPNLGRVDIRPKVDCRLLRLHAPTWLEEGSPSLHIIVDGQPRAYNWQARFLELGPVQAGQTARVEFDLPERQVQVVMSQKTYHLTLRGDTVVEISPAGVTGPLYHRPHFQQESPRWKEVQRFIPLERPDY